MEIRSSTWLDFLKSEALGDGKLCKALGQVWARLLLYFLPRTGAPQNNGLRRAARHADTLFNLSVSSYTRARIQRAFASKEHRSFKNPQSSSVVLSSCEIWWNPWLNLPEDPPKTMTCLSLSSGYRWSLKSARKSANPSVPQRVPMVFLSCLGLRKRYEEIKPSFPGFWAFQVLNSETKILLNASAATWVFCAIKDTYLLHIYKFPNRAAWERTVIELVSCYSCPEYPLVMTNIAMENHHFQWVNPL